MLTQSQCYLTFRLYAPRIYTEGPRTKKNFSSVLGKRGGWKKNKERAKRSGKNLCMKHRDSFLKNKFAMLSGFVEGQNLSGWF